MRKRLRDALHEHLLPAVERAFDEISPGAEVLHVPRLELHVRIRSADEIPDVLPELIHREILERLTALLHAGRAAPRSLAVRSVSARQSRLDLLARFLATGVLPWVHDGTDRAEVIARLQPESVEEAALALKAALALEATQIRNGLDRDLVAFTFRLLQLLPESDWAAFASAVARSFTRRPSEGTVGLATFRSSTITQRPGDQPTQVAAGPQRSPTGSGAGMPSMKLGEDLVAAIAALAAGGSGLTRYARLRLAAAATAVALATQTGASVMAAELLALLVEEAGEATGRSVQESIARLPEGARAFFGRFVDAAPASAAPPESKGAAGPARVAAPPGERMPVVAVSAPATVLAVPEDGTRDPALEPFGLACSHVGLILLHPFLARFFESTRIKRPDRPELPMRTMPRACALLHLLATGEDEAPEFTFGFIKVLLGLTPESPLPIAAGLVTAGDRDEADGLLQSVIDHWRALRSTSVQGLRASFLQRRGLLREEEQGFRLQVEPAAFDVLLHQLPWGFGVVKLSWMQKPIFTEWPTL